MPKSKDLDSCKMLNYMLKMRRAEHYGMKNKFKATDNGFGTVLHRYSFMEIIYVN